MIYTELLSHQIDKIIPFIANKDTFGIFAAYGTGKTLCALKYIDMCNLKKVLIVSTKTCIQNTWPQQIKEHTDMGYVLLEGSRNKRILAMVLGIRKCVNLNETVLFLLNFGGVDSLYNELINLEFDMIIVDESTKIKNPYAIRTKALIQLSESISRRCIMTGFPISEGLQNIYSQIKFLDHGELFGVSYDAFLSTYFVTSGYKRVPKYNAKNKIVEKIRDLVIYVPDSVIKKPDIMNKTIYVDKTKQQALLLQQLTDFYKLEIGDMELTINHIFSFMMKSLQICNGFIQIGDTVEYIDTMKDEALIDTIEEIDYEHNKIIIWCYFKDSIKRIKQLLQNNLKLVEGINFTSITGEVKNITIPYELFNYGKCNILLCTLSKASESLNLTNARYAIYFTNIWSADVRRNSKARILRLGSSLVHKSIGYIDLTTKDSIENKILLSLNDKIDLVESIKKLLVY